MHDDGAMRRDVDKNRPVSEVSYPPRQKRNRRLKDNVFFLFLSALTHLAVIAGIFVFTIIIGDMMDDRITRTWILLTTKVPGNSGKMRALEFLNKQKWCLPFRVHCFWPRESLIGIDLSAQTLGGAAYLVEANLQEAHLQNANLQEADLQRAMLQDANLRGAGLRKVKFQETNLWGADLRGANLQDANLQKANLKKTELQGTNFQKATLQEADLQGANLLGAQLQNAVLYKTNLRDANLLAASLQGANLWEASLQGAKLQKSKLQAAILRGADLSGADFTNAYDLTQAQISSACIQPGSPVKGLPKAWQQPPPCTVSEGGL